MGAGHPLGWAPLPSKESQFLRALGAPPPFTDPMQVCTTVFLCSKQNATSPGSQGRKLCN